MIQSLPPQIRENPAALAQLMHSNSLFGLQAAGIAAAQQAAAAASSLPAPPTSSAPTTPGHQASPLGNLFKYGGASATIADSDQNTNSFEEEKQKLNDVIREQSKPHALTLLQQQQVGSEIQRISNRIFSLY